MAIAAGVSLVMIECGVLWLMLESWSCVWRLWLLVKRGRGRLGRDLGML